MSRILMYLGRDGRTPPYLVPAIDPQVARTNLHRVQTVAARRRMKRTRTLRPVSLDLYELPVRPPLQAIATVGKPVADADALTSPQQAALRREALLLAQQQMDREQNIDRRALFTCADEMYQYLLGNSEPTVTATERQLARLDQLEQLATVVAEKIDYWRSYTSKDRLAALETQDPERKKNYLRTAGVYTQLADELSKYLEGEGNI